MPKEKAVHNEKVVIDATAEEVTEVKPFDSGTSPSLFVNLVRENRLFRFEMPIGAKLTECVEACEECLRIITKITVDAKVKEKLEKEKAEKEAAEKEKENKEDAKSE